jgi:branched-chain amino acid transport system substrate-binding protein
MNMKKYLAMLLASAMCVSLLAGCGSKSDSNTSASDDSTNSTSAVTTASGTFKIGGIGPLTGEAAIYGNAAMNGAQLAVDEINALGGPIQFEFKAQDDVADGETAVNAYNNLMDWGMQVLIGPVTSGAAIAVAAEVYQDRVFALTPSASSTDVTSGNDNVFQVCFTDPNQGVTSADYMAENMSDAKIAIIYRNDDAYSQGIRDAFVAEASAKGLEIVSEGTFTKDTATDFSVLLTAAQNKGADVVFLPIYYQPASIILSQAQQMGYAPTFFGVDGMDGILTLEGFNLSLAEGVMLMTPFNAWGTDDLTTNFVSAYEARYGDTPNQFAADGYDCVYAIYNALIAAGATSDMSAEELCEKLVAVFTDPNFTVDGLTGTDMTWAVSGEVSKSPVVVVIEDGIYVTQ